MSSADSWTGNKSEEGVKGAEFDERMLLRFGDLKVEERIRLRGRSEKVLESIQAGRILI